MLRTQRATEISYSNFAHHLHTNTIGPIITAQRLLATGLPIGTIVFMSSDSGSALSFRDFEDGFGGYAASKAALNQMLRVCRLSITTSASSIPFLALLS
jgi:NAD(P)-dependent dehydrogenase (short-subunit alcohol dehydrogenase family)